MSEDTFTTSKFIWICCKRADLEVIATQPMRK